MENLLIYRKSQHQNLFSKKCNADKKEIKSFLENLTISEVSNFQKENCDGVLSKKEIFESLKSFSCLLG